MDYVDIPIETILSRLCLDTSLGTNEQNSALIVETLAIFDHDYLGYHLLVQVADRSQRPSPWSYQLFLCSTEQVLLIHDYGTTKSVGQVPFADAAARVQAWRRRVVRA